MFKLSKKAEYAIRTVFHLAYYRDVCITEDIANAQQVPKAFLKKIIQSLRIGGLIASAKGKSGGITLQANPEELTIKDVIEKIEGPICLNDCLMYEGACERDVICPVHEMWKECEQAVFTVLSAYNFARLVNRYKELVEANKENIKDGVLLPNSIPVLDTAKFTR